MEILQQIIHKTIPADIESFILLCTSVHYATGQGLLERYNSFRQKYRSIRIKNMMNVKQDLKA
jgi:hypothetical protein